MNCLKCGQEISEDEVFCMDCQLDAQRYPIDPGAVVFIPKQKTPEVPKKAVRRRVVPLEDQIKILQKRLRVTTGLLILALLLALVSGWFAFFHANQAHYQKGQNYSPMVTIPAATEDAPAEPAE